jgi:hypothetical protein
VNGFYDALIAQLDRAVEDGFLPPQHRAKLIICEHEEEIYTTLTNLGHPQRFVV